MPLQPKFLNRPGRSITLAASSRATQIRKDLWNFKPVIPQMQLVDGVFEGGGALGAAYTGALRALHDNHIWFARVAGNSAGSITAAMIAVGFTAPEFQWLSSGFQNAPAAPQSLTARGITSPIAFSDFLDLPSLNTVSANSMHKTILWKALKGTIIDEIGKTQLPIPTQSSAVDACKNGLLAAPLIGPALHAIPGFDDLLTGVLNAALSPLPNRAPTVASFLPNTSALRTQFADTIWPAIAKNAPVELLLTNLLHEGSLFEGNVFLTTIKQLFGRKIHNNPTATVLFSDLKIPLAVIAADTDQGRMVVYSSKTNPTMEVAEAVRRSMSVPFVFQPRGAAGQIVDGGLCSNFPLWLFTAGGQNVVAQVGNDDNRPKLGFVLQEGLAAKSTWNVQPARFTPVGRPPKVDDMLVVQPILLEKLKALGLQKPNVEFPEQSANQDLADLKLVREISGVMGIDKEDSSHAAISKGLMAGSTYFDVLLPLLGYHWLDFHVNEDEDDVLAMWDRAWHATIDTLGATPLTGTGQGLIANASAQQSPYKVS